MSCVWGPEGLGFDAMGQTPDDRRVAHLTIQLEGTALSVGKEKNRCE